jgi:TonB family protein
VYRSENAGAYAAALAQSAKFIGRKAEPLLAPGAFGSPHAVVARIRRVIERRAPIQLKLNTYAIGGTTMFFIIAALTLQSFSPVMASTPPLTAQGSAPAALAAAGKTCTNPNADVTVTDPAPPVLSKSAKLHGSVQGSVRLTIAPNGKVISAKIDHSTGNAAADQAVLNAAKSSKYSPKIVDCKPVQGTYLFLVRLNPQ